MITAAYAAFAAFRGGAGRSERFVRSAERAMVVTLALLSVAVAGLAYAFITRDFNVEYVASYSSRDLPLIYTVAAMWGGQKGSLLLWAWLLSLFGTVVVAQNRHRHRELMPYVVGVLAVVLVFFAALLTFVTPPLERLAFTPADGQGLNPMLQNPGMVFHPTTLYLGYVGFAVPFAWGIAALMTGRLDDEWITTTRRWTVFAWLFLTWGNLLGAQWAYVELGWGGYWAWDPVENASFLPWLTGTAFLHSVMIQEKKNMLKVWNMVLIIVTFALTMFGTFLTRSGVISSVHSFGASGLGPPFLGFIAATLIFSFGLLANRMHLLRSRNELDSVVSRESSFLTNNLLFVVAAFAVFWGTVFPLISEAVRGVKITVGPPFYNQVTIPLFLLLLALMGVCPLIAWRRATTSNLHRNFVRPGVAGVLTLASLYALGMRDAYALISFALAAFVTATIGLEFYRGTRARREIGGKGWPAAVWDLVGRNHRRYGGYLVHLGVVLVFVGVTGKAFVQETDATLGPGESADVADYTVTFRKRQDSGDADRYSVGALLDVARAGRPVGTLMPARRFYRSADEPSTEAGIRSTLRDDLYVMLASYEDDRATLKIILNPLTAWLWIGGIVMSIGTLIALVPDHRQRRAMAERLLREEEAAYATVA